MFPVYEVELAEVFYVARICKAPFELQASSMPELIFMVTYEACLAWARSSEHDMVASRAWALGGA